MRGHDRAGVVLLTVYSLWVGRLAMDVPMARSVRAATQ